MVCDGGGGGEGDRPDVRFRGKPITAREAMAELVKPTRIGNWIVWGEGPGTEATLGDGEIVKVSVFQNEQLSIECHDGAVIPFKVLDEMFRRMDCCLGRER